MENKNNRSCLAMFEKSLKSNILHDFAVRQVII